jgi:uncharacterized membrane protein YhaH (DUF805 family)
MNFIQSIQSGYMNYVNFSGRACRSEFWFWVLYAMLLGIVASVIDVKVLGLGAQSYGLRLVVDLVNLLPGIAVTVRRLHDINRKGWWMLIALTLIGLIPLIYWYCQPGTSGENRFGANKLPATAGKQDQAF